ncbi:hypothetical protein J2Z69_003420 [Paenibacillus shirakamiensis]|uniref:DUF4446 family protein n=1 Tax=Paenibacillus shirakamiensis TaxID=1265935 RepID=A0ABS4JKW2_9BACL|nr:DUF4446 family protein [Paenibacillus shirakamiensis]MBP2002348.1 hypothetical protein [Paenibacillus shirakamiensis]
MREWNDLVKDQLIWIVIIAAILFIWVIVWNIIQGSKLRRTRRKYETMMKGTGVENLETLLIDLKVQMDAIEDEHGEQQRQLQSLQKLLPKLKAKIGIKRYNAYGEHGNELSFSMAFLDDLKDGVVLTGIYNREGCFMYAKPLTKGESLYSLSPEEKDAIHLAEQQA